MEEFKEIKYCEKCGKKLEGNYCKNPDCRELDNSVFCVFCGTKNSRGNLKCRNCRGKISKKHIQELKAQLAQTNVNINVREDHKVTVIVEKEPDVTPPKKPTVSYSAPWPDDAIEWDTAALEKAGYTSAKRDTRESYYILVKGGAESAFTCGMLKQRGLVIALSVPEPAPRPVSEPQSQPSPVTVPPVIEPPPKPLSPETPATPYCDSWPSDGIKWNVERLKAYKFTAVQRGDREGSYVLTKNGTSFTYDATKLIKMGFAAKQDEAPPPAKTVKIENVLKEDKGPYCTPWPSDGIAWDEQRLKRMNVQKIRRGPSEGTYILTNKMGKEQSPCDRERVTGLGFARLVGSKEEVGEAPAPMREEKASTSKKSFFWKKS